jgi:triphosphoribosyl-dephospho-CoA synthase
VSHAADIAAAAQLACLLEVSAPKPGNVSPGRNFADTRYEDFLASAAAIGRPLAAAGTSPLGVTIRLAIEATSWWSRTNTNLGIVLLLAPLARAALLERTVRLKADPTAVGADLGADFSVRPKADPTAVGADLGADFSVSPKADATARASDLPSVGSGFSRTLREAVRRVLAATTIDDARDVYAAIRLASPGGLGKADAQDVADEPTATLLEVMRLAADRDGIAREYATAFDTTFTIGVPALVRARADRLSWDDAVVETYLTLLAAAPDTHAARRGGIDAARDISSRARSVLEAGAVRSPAGRLAIADLDRVLRDARHLLNPGTTADLTASTIFVVLLAGGWHA